MILITIWNFHVGNKLCFFFFAFEKWIFKHFWIKCQMDILSDLSFNLVG